MVGSAIVRRLNAEGYHTIITRTHAELNLTNQQAVRDFFQKEKIDYVVLAAAKVGGIHANNTYPADFIYQNLMIEANIIHEAYRAGIKRLLFLGSSCIYPKNAPQPMKEEYLLSGYLEPTNEPYAIAKIAGIKLCESYNRQYGTKFRSLMPTNLYGPNDNFNLENSHVIPALIRKFHLAKLVENGKWDDIQQDEKRFGPIPAEMKQAADLSTPSSSLTPQPSKPKVVIWGSGKPRREFLHVDDMAAACVFVMGLEDNALQKLMKTESSVIRSDTNLLNVGSGIDTTIAEAASLLKEIVGFKGEITFDMSKPDGAMQKLLDVSAINAHGWKASITLREGLSQTYDWYQMESLKPVSDPQS